MEGEERPRGATHAFVHAAYNWPAQVGKVHDSSTAATAGIRARAYCQGTPASPRVRSSRRLCPAFFLSLRPPPRVELTCYFAFTDRRSLAVLFGTVCLCCSQTSREMQIFHQYTEHQTWAHLPIPAFPLSSRPLSPASFFPQNFRTLARARVCSCMDRSAVVYSMDRQRRVGQRRRCFNR